LREKQKVRRIYGVLERQFRKYFAIASSSKGSAGDNLLGLLERRLDNVVFKLGFSSTRSESRQVVKHNHVLVNGKRMNIPSYIVKVGDKIEIHPASKKMPLLARGLAFGDRRVFPSWLSVDKETFSGDVKSLPLREELNEPVIKEQYIIEYYSR